MNLKNYYSWKSVPDYSCGGSRNLADTWFYDLEMNRWSKNNSEHTPPARIVGSAVYCSDYDQVIIFGGLSQDFSNLDDTWIFSGISGEWESLEQ